MEELYMVLIERGKTYNKMNKEAVIQHVDYIRRMDDAGRLVFCGLLKGMPGVAGMYIVKADSYEEAKDICEAEPLVIAGFATYKLVTVTVANRDNNYLL